MLSDERLESLGFDFIGHGYNAVEIGELIGGYKKSTELKAEKAELRALAGQMAIELDRAVTIINTKYPAKHIQGRIAELIAAWRKEAGNVEPR